jgi:hypothetical protein
MAREGHIAEVMKLRNSNRLRNGTAAIVGAAITIRPAYADDELSLSRLAALDSAPIPAAPILIAEVDGELRAALSLSDGAAIADPFFPTLHLVELLRSHSAAAERLPQRRLRYRLRFA